MAKRRKWKKYKFIVDGRIKHKGITKDLERREQEHRQKYGKGRLKQVGRAVTEDSAREWEKDQGVS